MSKQLSLLKLTLRNFKGAKNFVLDVQGRNAKVYGDNETGKTTTFDAFIWLLFDKDSENKKDFSLKTLDAQGNELHGLDHEVEGEFLLDGRKLTLKKVYAEKWTKKRGSATPEFTGHTTDYFIDGVPVKKKEYTEMVDSIVQEDVFKLLTSPSYFNERLHYTEKRKILLEICGDITDAEVISSDASLAKLPSILGDRSIEDHRKVIAARQRKINEELKTIPVRIDEINRNMPEINGLDKSALEAQVGTLNIHIDEKMTQINSIRNGKTISDKQKAIQEIEMRLLEIKRDHDSDSKDKVYQLKTRIQEESSNKSILESKLENIKTQKRYNDENIQSIEANLARLRDEWQEVNGQKFTHTDACECPACGQALPEAQVNAAKEKALSQFNLQKSKKLEDINAKGKQGKERKEAILQDNEKLAKEYEKLNSQIAEKNTALSKLNEQLQQQESMVTDILDNPQYTAKLQEKMKLEEDIKNLREMTESSVQDIQVEIMGLRDKRDSLQADIGKFAAVAQSETRIEELQSQERELAAEYEKLEEELYLTEEFIRTKVNLLTDKINSKFKYARFKLFEQQVNGGLQETCVTTYKGVPYDSGLNNAAKINVGLDIINTLSAHYGFYAPIFVDNSEAVTKLIETNSQTISLVVSEKDKQLRVEVDAAEMKEAI